MFGATFALAKLWEQQRAWYIDHCDWCPSCTRDVHNSFDGWLYWAMLGKGDE